MEDVIFLNKISGWLIIASINFHWTFVVCLARRPLFFPHKMFLDSIIFPDGNQSISLVFWDWRDPHCGAFQPKSICVSQLPYKPLQKACALRKSPLSSQTCGLGVAGRKTGLLRAWWGLPDRKAHSKDAHSWPHAATDWSGSSFVAENSGCLRPIHLSFSFLSSPQLPSLAYIPELTLQRPTL